MTEIEAKALALVNGCFLEVNIENMSAIAEAYRSLHERHEAFKQEVSDTVEGYLDPKRGVFSHHLQRLIIAKPDPLVEAMDEWQRDPVRDDDYSRLRAALAKRGLEIVEKK